MYPTVIIGAQKKINFIPGAQGKGIRFVVYWKAGLENNLQQIKVNLVLYENEILQISGSGFFLWTMDHYQVYLITNTFLPQPIFSNYKIKGLEMFLLRHMIDNLVLRDDP